ncbi:MAG: type III-B CRISPR-associated protein Cas10/Cmr2 [Moraxellaceae bacterium]|nr:type III-B CRISPR-associated protein Cas10/Cmr2 [Moraxellaceae bacterium]
MTTSSEKYFHFTLGPVQSFVAQARRTRDFWAGSFLLSWLSAVAIQAVKVQGGTIVFPIPDDKFLQAIADTDKKLNKDDKPTQGGIPNRFMADISGCTDFNANAVCNAVQQAWQAVADSVWEKDKKGLEQNTFTKEIWQRQITSFWDMSWVITNSNDSSALDKRKNLRSHVPSVEDGFKCMMMEGYQELSGTTSGKKLREFWINLKLSLKSGLDLREDERLCAIAYVKRRFVHEFDNVSKNIKIADKSISVNGWKLPKNVPSVGYMASVSWLKEILIDNTDDKFIDAFNLLTDRVEELGKIDSQFAIQSERKNHIHSIRALINKNKAINISLDGQIYYKTYWENPNNLFADREHRTASIENQAGKIKQALSKLYDKVGQEPSPYYAIVLMDGDSLGKQMSHIERQSIISNALNQFTQNVSEIVENHDGFLVYAGGDDVLALFSLDDALPASIELQQKYKECFTDASKEKKNSKDKNVSNDKKVEVFSTLSGAINYCHLGNPLTQVLSDSHDLLDNVAKDGRRRNALAVRVWKPSGLAVQWSLPWSKVIDENNTNENVIKTINEEFGLNLDPNTAIISALATAMGKQKTDDQKVSIFSTGFFYKTRELMQKLMAMQQPNEEEQLSDEQARKLLLAEYLQSGQFNKISDEQREKLMFAFNLLLEQSKDYHSKIDDGKANIDENSGKKLSGEAGILLRILGQKGLGKGDK